MTAPSTPAAWPPLHRPDAGDRRRRAVDTLQALALDESLKAALAADPLLTTLARRVAARYVAGEHRDAALARADALGHQGHRTTVDFMGESARDPGVADAATAEFVGLAEAIAARGLDCSVSLDLSHLGSLVDRDLGLRNARTVARATQDAGIEMVVSMEGHDRVDQILADHATLSAEFDHVGITVQARLRRTPRDLDELLQRPGRIRLVKGAYGAPASAASAPDAAETLDAYDDLAARLVRSGHLCSIATHDVDRIDHVGRLLAAEPADPSRYHLEFLDGLGPEQAAEVSSRGIPTQVYVVYGTEWWLYVCNRLAEDPDRLLDAVVDLAADRAG
ncbi:MAG: proline dehydrogenase family protein [Phycicoccus sp.]